MSGLPERVRVSIEVSAGSRVKRGSDGRVDFISPIACPFNYGCAPDTRAEDGEPVDVLVLGPRLPRGPAGTLRRVGRVRFMDAGQVDDKWICGAAPPSAGELRRLARFFRFYALCKRLARPRRRGPTRFLGIEVSGAADALG